jgi:hypothetical protein
MSHFKIVLFALACAILLVGAVHLLLGLRADALLGASVPEAALADPTLESQNRFLGVSFTLYAAILFLAAGDLRRYAPALRAALAIFFAAGLARLVAWAQFGAPAPPALALLVIELIAPPILYLWLARQTADS